MKNELFEVTCPCCQSALKIDAHLRAVISHVAQPGQQVRCTTLAALGELAHIPAPSLLIAGWTVGNIAAVSQLIAAGVQIQ